MPDRHFLISLRDRLLLPVCQEGDRCQHRKQTGLLCGAYLDARGRHARACNAGGAVVARHNSIRDWTAAAWTQCTGTPAQTEQHVPQWDKIDPHTQEVEEAILDVATADLRTGSPLYVDVVVKTTYSEDPARLRARARKDGRAAAEAANRKRTRYADAGTSLIPLAFEDGGRPCEETVSFIRMLGAARTSAEDGSTDWGGTARLWQECSTLLQLGNAEIILSANGR